MNEPSRSERSLYSSLIELQRKKCIVFTEGKDGDGYLVEMIFSEAKVVAMSELEVVIDRRFPPGVAKGKVGALKMYDEFKSSAGCGSLFKVFCFVDKDIDDLTGKMRKSDDIFYTKWYCIENEFLLGCNLTKSIGAASGLAIGSFNPCLESIKRSCIDVTILCILHFILEESYDYRPKYEPIRYGISNENLRQ